MTLLVFILLVVLWGAVFIPAIVRARLDSSPIATVGMFRRGMHALSASGRAFSGGRWIVVPPTAEQMMEARRQSLARHRHYLAWLLLASVTTLLLGFLPGLHILLRAHLVTDVAVLCYVVFLKQTRQRRLETAPTAGSAADRERIIDLRGEASEALTIFEEDEEPRYLKVGHF